MAPFRTDSQPPGKTSLQPLRVAQRIETPRYQLTTGDNGQVASLIVQGKQFLSNEPTVAPVSRMAGAHAISPPPHSSARTG